MPFFMPVPLPHPVPVTAPPAITRTITVAGQQTAQQRPAEPAAVPSPVRANSPNIIVIVSDDQGYADVGFHQSKEIKTPNLDALARSGVICTAGYVTFPVCSPSRVGLLTGRHGARFGYDTNPGDQSATDAHGLPLSERMIPELFNPYGYVTGMVGKWHLGTREQFHPNRRGFQEFFGFLGGGHRYMDWTENDKNAYTAPILRNSDRVSGIEGRYLTEVFSDEACAFVERHKAKPFFLYLAYNAPHEPLQAPQKYLDRYPGLTGRRKTYAAMVSALDDGVGQLREKLKALGLEKNTLVFFFSDNGGPTNDNASSNLPLRGHKSQVFEGGIRVPYVVSWPGTLPAGTRYPQPVSTLDILPTMLGAVEANTDEMPSREGVNLLPFLTGKTSAAPHDRLYWRHINGSWAIREKQWKLVRDPRGQRLLFDIESDRSETKNVSAAHPEIAARLAGAWNTWNAGNAGRIPWTPQQNPTTPTAK
jgi:arylsulfatase A-like enzyme